MKILYLQDDFPPNSFGGAGIVAFQLAKKMQEYGHEIFVFCVTQKKDEEGWTEYDGLKIFQAYSNYSERWRAYISLYNISVLLRLKKVLREINPDVVHAHNIHKHISYYAFLMSKRSGAKVFLTAHDVMSFHYGKLNEFINSGNPTCDVESYKITPWQQLKKYKLRYNPIRNTIIKFFLKSVDKIIAVSHELQIALEQNGITNVTVIHNGIDTSVWEIDPYKIQNFKEEHKLTNKKIILFGGRLSKDKGAEQMLQVLRSISQKEKNVVLVIMGVVSEYAKELIKIARALGVEDKLIFTGWISNDSLRACYLASDVVVVPSIYLEPFATINLEGMASQKPVIATCFGGPKEAIQHNFCGFVVNPYAVNMFSEYVLLLLSDKDRAREFGKNGYLRAKQCFSLEKQIEKTILLYTTSKPKH